MKLRWIAILGALALAVPAIRARRQEARRRDDRETECGSRQRKDQRRQVGGSEAGADHHVCD
jgi:hypothetical protein